MTYSDPNQHPVNVYNYPNPTPASTNGLATASMVLGIIGVVFCWVPFLNFILGVLALAFGGTGWAKANKLGGLGKGQAIAGVVMGVVALIGAILLWAAFSAAMSNLNTPTGA